MITTQAPDNFTTSLSAPFSAARTAAQTCGQGWNKRFSAYATWPSAFTVCHPMVAAVSERGRSVMPVLFAAATDPGLHRALGDVLRERYGGGYSVVVASEPAAAIGQLAAFRDSGEQVALLLAPFRMAELDGIDFLVRAHDLHPGAGRIVIVDVGDVGAAAELRRALTLNQIDSYFGQPWASPEEELHPVIGETLRRWARDHQPRYEKARIVDDPNGSRGKQLRSWLERNAVATALLPADTPAGRALLAERGLSAERLPVAVLYDGTVLINPANDELAEALGADTHPRQDRYDVAIIGAGPSGLAAALSAGAEGLRAVVLEQEAVGGQAGTTSKIRNYLGFPWGLSGAELAERATRQAEQLGAEFVVARSAAGLRPAGAGRIVTLSNGEEITAAAVMLAGGVAYRRLGIPSVDSLVDAGVFYGAAVSEAQSMDGLDVFVLGGGNSAGQAAAHLADAGARVTILVRGASLTSSMSDYLIRQLQGSPRVTVRLGTEVTGGGTGRRLDHLVIRDRSTGLASNEHADALFIFIGARPRTDWLNGVLATDPHGFLLTGADVLHTEPRTWPDHRPPLWLETRMPGVFAAGDIRSGSIKRVAAAVGEGSTATTLVLEYLKTASRTGS